MLKTAIALCLLVQVSAADPEIEAALGGSYTMGSNYSSDDSGPGPEVILGGGVPVSSFAILGLQASYASHSAASDARIHAKDYALRATATRHFGPLTLQLGAGVGHTAATMDGAYYDSFSPTTFVARLSAACQIVALDEGALEVVAGIERSPLLNMVFDSTVPQTTLFLGIGYRLRGLP